MENGKWDKQKTLDTFKYQCTRLIDDLLSQDAVKDEHKFSVDLVRARLALNGNIQDLVLKFYKRVNKVSDRLDNRDEIFFAPEFSVYQGMEQKKVQTYLKICSGLRDKEVLWDYLEILYRLSKYYAGLE